MMIFGIIDGGMKKLKIIACFVEKMIILDFRANECGINSDNTGFE
jgi:hypothetical protein